MPGFTALLDACVLYPAPVRDLLIESANTHVYRARWSNHIHEEWISNVLKNNPKATPEALARALRWVLKFERLDGEKRLLQEMHEADIVRYMAALDIEATPLWRAAIAREVLEENKGKFDFRRAPAREKEPVN